MIATMSTEAKVALTPSRLKEILLSPGWVHTQRFDDFIPGHPTRLAFLTRDMTLGEVTLRHFVELRLDRENKQVELKDDHKFEGWWLYGDFEIVNEDGTEAEYPQDDLLTLVIEGCWASNPEACAHLFDLDLSGVFDALPRS